MRPSRFTALAFVVFAMAALAGCGDDSPTTPSNPNQTTETFEGTLTTNGAATHQFSSAGSGTVTATLTNISTESGTVAPVVGLSVGSFALNACSAAVSNDLAFTGTVVTGSASAALRLCVRIYDAQGRITETVKYTITVQHP